MKTCAIIKSKMNSDEFYDYEDRSYIEPTLSSDEQKAFISNLRDIQEQNNAQIAQQTYNLGTQVPSNLGGLGGGEAYFNARYQTPQVDEMVATLKSAADAQELNDIMSNYQAQLKNRYSQAQRNYNKRQRARQNAYYNSLLGGNNPTSSNGQPDNLDIEDSGISSGSGDITQGNITSTYIPGAQVTTTVGTLEGGNEVYADGERVYENGQKSKKRVRKTRTVLKYDPWSEMTYPVEEEYYVYE